MVLASTYSDLTGLIAALAGFVGAVAAVVAALKGHAVQRSIKPPSNSVSIGALAENAAVIQHQAVSLLADMVGKNPNLPTPQATANNVPGATLASPPPTPTDRRSAPPTPPSP